MTRITGLTVLEQYFQQFRNNIIGIDQMFVSPYGEKKNIYTDWTASGRLYRPIEERLMNDFGPFVSKAQTETAVSGTAMTKAYHYARKCIKVHANANSDDVLIIDGTGVTGVVNKFQRILGLKLSENFKDSIKIDSDEKPIVFISHMEHHSNHTSWLETIADVEVIPSCENGLFSLENLEILLEKYRQRVYKIASITACSNVTGILTPYYKVAKLMHQYEGVCFVDFACSAPYVKIDMHPQDSLEYLDAVFFSPHKFLGGPGTSGVLIFNKKLYSNMVPDCPGGGAVNWTNPWGEHQYIDNIEERENGGTPGFLQTIRIALAIELKNKMGIENMLARKQELVNFVFNELGTIHNIKILASKHRERLGVISFCVEDLHFNLGVKLLNDKFGIQSRGGCSCAGTYCHFLLDVDQETSQELAKEIALGHLIRKPGWIRISIHPTTTTEEIKVVCNAIKLMAEKHKLWALDYWYNKDTNEFIHKNTKTTSEDFVKSWFEL